MNGRIYDPTLGRFLSADPFVGSAYDSQDYNRYSYLGNNPLGGTDPSGYFKLSLKQIVTIVAVVVISVVTYGAASAAATAAMTSTAATATTAATFSIGGMAISASTAGVIAGAAGGAAAGFASGFAGSLLNGGSIGDAFKAGVIGAAAGAITGGVAAKANQMWGQGKLLSGRWAKSVLANGVAGGASAEMEGGEFRHGFYSAALTAGAAGSINANVSNRYGKIVAAAVVGGTASAVGGGKFANGAISGAFTYVTSVGFDREEKLDVKDPNGDSGMVLGIHSNVEPDTTFADGHAWLSVQHASGDTITLGLYPDEHAAVTDNGPGTDMRLNIEKARLGTIEGKYNLYHKMTNLEAARFSMFVNKTAPWLYTNTCATWSAAGYNYATGTGISAREWLLFGTPRALSKSIEQHSGNKP